MVGEGAVEQSAVYASPYAVYFLQAMFAVAAWQFTGVAVVEETSVDEHSPPYILITAQHIETGSDAQQFASHALVGTYVVITACGCTVCDGVCMLPVVVDAVAKPYLARGEIVQACGVVVAVGSATVVVGMAVKETFAGYVYAVDVPLQASFKRLTSRQHRERLHRVGDSGLAVALVPHRYAEEHAVGLWK